MEQEYNFIFYIILLYLIYRFILFYFIEKFINFENIPKEIGDNIKTNEPAELPKIIHHICPTDFKKWNQKWFLCYHSWKSLYPPPEYTHMHWDDKELTEFIDTNYPWFSDMYKSYDVNIKRYDIARLFLLYHYGGIYADMDYIVYKNFFDELPKDKISIPESPYKWNEEIQNSLMMSPPKQEFWLLAIDAAYNKKDYDVFSATGPQLLTPIYNKYPDLVNKLPVDLYNPNVYDSTTYDETKIYAKHLLTTVWNKSASNPSDVKYDK